MIDCVVVGGGPAGLTAAIYLARFHLEVAVFDAGNSRAASIPKTRNHAGFPAGIPGSELLARMHTQAIMYGATVTADSVTQIATDGPEFAVETGGNVFAARAVLIATGVVNRRPPYLSEEAHRDALERGLLRYCPVCDGYEVTDKDIGVFGTAERGMKEAIFLRSYSKHIKLIAPEVQHDLTPQQLEKLREAGIGVVEGLLTGIDSDDAKINVTIGNVTLSFDSLYPALGSDIRSELARKLGAQCTEDGCLIVDEHMRTSVPKLFAAGDVVKGLDQISHAMGQGGVAATTIRNDLAQMRSQLR